MFGVRVSEIDYALLMKCKFVDCVNELPENARKGTLFCCDVCRAAEHRRMLALRIAPDQSNKVRATGSSADPERSPENAHKGHKRRRPQTSVPSTSEKARSVRATPVPKDKTRARVPFDQQVRSQAPDGAAGYRLVLPIRAQTESPRIIPSADASGALRYYRLDPFELPDDLRLQDGHSYRILWVDSQGQPLAPKGTQSLPALYVFLGPPDADIRVEEIQLQSQHMQLDLQLQQSAQKQQQSGSSSPRSSMGIRVDLPLVLAVAAMIVRYVKGTSNNDVSLDQMERALADVLAKGTADSHQSPDSQTGDSHVRTETPKPDASADPDVTNDVSESAPRLGKNDEHARRGKDTEVASPCDSQTDVLPSVESKAALDFQEQPAPRAVSPRSTIIQRETIQQEEFAFDFEMPIELPNKWPEHWKSLTFRRGQPTTIKLFCWLHRPERVRAVIAEIAGAHPSFEPDSPSLEQNPKLSEREKQIVRRILTDRKALTFALVKYEKMYPEKQAVMLLPHAEIKLALSQRQSLDESYDSGARAEMARSSEQGRTDSPSEAELPKPEIALVPALKRAAYAERFGLSESDAVTIAAIVMHADRLQQFEYEHRKESATQNGEAPPAEPLLSLSPDERKRIRSIARDGTLCAATLLARTEFDEHSQRDPDSLLCLPHPFESLRSQDVAQLRQISMDDDRSKILSHQLACQACVRTELPRPRLPATKLPNKVLKELAKLAQDRRIVAYWQHLNHRIGFVGV